MIKRAELLNRIGHNKDRTLKKLLGLSIGIADETTRASAAGKPTALLTEIGLFVRLAGYPRPIIETAPCEARAAGIGKAKATCADELDALKATIGVLIDRAKRQIQDFQRAQAEAPTKKGVTND